MPKITGQVKLFPLPSLPKSPSPHVYNSPSSVTAALCRYPADTHTTTCIACKGERELKLNCCWKCCFQHRRHNETFLIPLPFPVTSTRKRDLNQGLVTATNHKASNFSWSQSKFRKTTQMPNQTWKSLHILLYGCTPSSRCLGLATSINPLKVNIPMPEPNSHSHDWHHHSTCLAWLKWQVQYQHYTIVSWKHFSPAFTQSE